MDTTQNILVIITFAAAIGFLITKFVWKPAFLGGNKKKTTKSCGSDGCGCD